MLRLYKITGEALWLRRAATLGEAAVLRNEREPMLSISLYKGITGLALLLADLEQPKHSCMPLCESDV
jgi:hypothetical protein